MIGRVSAQRGLRLVVAAVPGEGSPGTADGDTDSLEIVMTSQ